MPHAEVMRVNDAWMLKIFSACNYCCKLIQEVLFECSFCMRFISHVYNILGWAFHVCLFLQTSPYNPIVALTAAIVDFKLIITEYATSIWSSLQKIMIPWCG